MGGGTGLKGEHTRSGYGLSPRGGGNRGLDERVCFHLRSIPAWAGEPNSSEHRCLRKRVYPRVGGGTTTDMQTTPPVGGLSPRGRGNPNQAVHDTNDAGSIPAWAGEPRYIAAFSGSARVYPRVGGGTISFALSLATSGGLSPRGRGNLRQCGQVIHALRSIPAWAGEPTLTSSLSGLCTVYPRVGGGTIGYLYISGKHYGLSPRGRGNLFRHEKPVPVSGSIPAWAGEPSHPTHPRHSLGVYPRVGGGTDLSIFSYHKHLGLSPRGRGNPDGPPHAVYDPRSIPAWAGEPIAT